MLCTSGLVIDVTFRRNGTYPLQSLMCMNALFIGMKSVANKKSLTRPSWNIQGGPKTGPAVLHTLLVQPFKIK